MGERGKARTWVIAFVLAFGGGLGALVGIGCAIDANACPFTDAEPLTTTEGSEIWVARCIVCHGPEGTGTEQAPRAPNLVEGESATLDLETLIDRIGRGSLGLMPRFRSELTDEQIEAVARFVLELRGDPDGQ